MMPQDFSVLNRTYECDTWEAAYRFGVVGLPYGALCGGALTGKYISGSSYAKAAEADRAASEWRQHSQPNFQPRYHMPAAMLATKEYVKLAEKYSISPTELALAWSNQRPCNSAVITGTTTVKQVGMSTYPFNRET